MLKVDDRFKGWMRHRLHDREYAERVLRAVTELDDAVLMDSWLHAALPEESAADPDPEAMIGFLKGHVPSAGQDILVAIFGKWVDFEDLSYSYPHYLWSMYPVQAPEDEVELPVIYEIAFKALNGDEPIAHVRWCDQDGVGAKVLGLDKHKINLVNTRVDTEVLRLITSGKRHSDEAETHKGNEPETNG